LPELNTRPRHRKMSGAFPFIRVGTDNDTIG